MMNRRLELHLEELITVYPENLRSYSQNFRKHPVKHDPRVEGLKSEETRKTLEMDVLLCRLLWGQLQSIGCFTAKNQNIAGLKTKTGLRDIYGRWLEESIAIFVRENYLTREGESCVVKDITPADPAQIWQQWERQKAAWLAVSGWRAQVVLVEAMLQALPEILTGKRPATDIMFPNSSMEAVEGIYKNNSVADYFNEALADSVVVYVQERLRQEPSARIQILEIGAGTGGTSAGVFRKLQPYRDQIQEYCYTDLSQAFLRHAEKEYGPENPYLTYQIFNVEAAVAGQGITAGGYDIVIAANVLHATKNILQTLRNTKAILKKNGLLLLNEISGNSLFTHLTFGLLEGWWLYEDPEFRIPGCPGLAPGTWQEVLESEGFRSVFFPVQEAHPLGQQIVIAESDGVVRQKQPLKTGGASGKRSIGINHKSTQPPAAQDHHGVSIQGNAGVTDQMMADHLRGVIIGKVSESLKVAFDVIDVDDSFADYGVDSIIGVNLVQDINQTLKIELETTSLFEYSSVNQLTTYILSRFKDVILESFGQNPKQTVIVPETTFAMSNIKDETEEIPSLKRRMSRFAKIASESGSKPATTFEPVAVIGISGIFPMARDVWEFWQNLKEGKDCITEIPPDRWDWRAYYGDPFREANKTNIKWGGFIDGVAEFDPLFFGISPGDAEIMDPQQRLFLENCWKCFEDAGLNPAAISGSRCGVYVGCGASSYRELLGVHGLMAEGLMGNVSSILAARISYFLNLKGPCLAIDSACSSALAAITEACNGLVLQNCDLALAGGVSMPLLPPMYITSGNAGMLSPDGRTFTFDARANGFIPGEGVGVILLKRLSDAVRDQDQIYGVIRGWGTNQDGKTNGITAPSMSSQMFLEKEVYERFGINPESISLVEAHGAGTVLGDPIEVEALTKSFRSFTDKKNYCALGTVKSNIGHLLAAAGAAGVIKVLLALRHRTLPPTLHYETPNQHISLSNSPFYINTRLRPWESTTGTPRRAAVSSFGFSGTNAHIVIEEYLSGAGAAETPVSFNPNNPFVFVLSAKSQAQLRTYAERVKDFVQSRADLNLMDMAYTFQAGREALEYRLAFVADSREALLNKLDGFIHERVVPGILTGEVKKRWAGLGATETVEDAPSMFPTRIEKENLIKMAEKWVNGFNIDWNKLYGEKKPRRISLPTYPFARENYWVTEVNQGRTGGGESEAYGPATLLHPLLQLELKDNAEPVMPDPLETIPGAIVSQIQEAYELMTFEEVWHEQTMPAPEPIKIKNLVCFVSNQENRQIIGEVVSNIDQRTKIIFISQNKTYQKQSPQMYQIARGERNTYEEALRSIGEDYGEIDGILYLWPLEDSGCIQDYYAIVYLIQAIAAAKLKTKRVLLAGQFQDRLERCYLESWIGFERSLGLIMPHTQFTVIFEEAQKANRDVAMRIWIPRLWAELLTPKAQSVWFQSGKRHICRIRQISITAGESPVRAGGTYLITGGCGGLGLLFAEHLAKNQPVNLILTGRSPLNAEKQLKIKSLEDLGSRVFYVQADISDRAGMKERLNQAKERFGGIHGVIHAAGLQDHQSILQKDIPGFQKVLDPKIKGTLVLDELLEAESLGFICYFSSFSPILGDFGACNYSIANRFLMAYAHYRNLEQPRKKRPGKTMVINWPIWKEGGMAIGNDENIKMLLQSSGQRFLEAGEGLALFDRILAQNKTQVLVAAGQPSRVHRFFGMIEDQNPVGTSAVFSSPGKGRRPEMKGFSLEQCLEWDLKDQISKLLKIPTAKLDRKENLAGFGFNSINLTRFAAALSNHFGMEITPAVFYGYPTLQKLTQYFLQDHADAIREFYQEDHPEKAVSLKIPSGEVTLQRPAPLNSGFMTGSVRPGVGEPIAIIGMSGRFPQSRNIDEMWRILAEGRDVVQEIPMERFDWRKYYGDPAKEPGKINCKWCGIIPGVAEFDPLFFEISPKEAEMMDPRQRLLLQESWKALEDAGYGERQIRNGKIGMFVGVEIGDYQLLVKDKGSLTSNLNSILAARLAYFLNLNGPVMAIDTACSSGLVATHQAVLSLHNYECDTAIAAGVNFLLTPDAYMIMSQAGIFSGDGKCFTFDKRANGMVPGEAVAVVVLKRLSQAEADGDPIYAVIRGSGVNYDGKSNGITAPSGVSQTKLLKTVYDQYQINPEEIEYIVTHGTGTKLGDPIEVNALYDAFKDYTTKQGYCALTSTKTNFGHTYSPSGIISLISLAQAFRHELIPASLNCEQENDFINWKESPFYVNKSNKPWPSKGKKCRTGAVSAFGFSGTNAHLVVQSYEMQETRVSADHPPFYLLVLSAKTSEVLEEKIKDLIAVLQNKDSGEQDLLDISYTLLEGRQHFNHRLAMVIQDRQDAVHVLKQELAKEKLPNLFQGKVPRDFTGQKALERITEDLLQQSRSLKENKLKYQETLLALAEFYCQGYEIDGNHLYGDWNPRRLHLPTYLFAREHYWVPDFDARDGQAAATSTVTARLHPLLHQNTSDLFEQRFSSTFTGQENFLADYAVMGQRVMPGAVYLELARAAVEQATGASEDVSAGIRLKNVVWAKPIAVGNHAVPVHIGIHPDDKGEIAYVIYSRSDGEDTDPIIHGQGNAAFFSITGVPTLDLQALQAGCNQGSISSDQCYEAFRTVGINYGPWYQGVETVYVGPDQVLARLSLPSSPDPEDRFVLHPRVMEAAFQASIGFLMETGALKPACPLRLQELEIFGAGTSDGWVRVRPANGRTVMDRRRKFDIDLGDAKGRIWARLKGLELNPKVETMIPDALETTPASPAVLQTQEEYELVTFEEVWQGQALPKACPAKLKTVVCFLSDPDNQQASAELASTLDPETKLVFISQNSIYQKESLQRYQISRPERNTYAEAFRSIREDYGEVDALLYLWPLEDPSCIRDYSGIVYLIQAIDAAQLKIKQVLLAAQFADELERCYLESWIGFERSLGLVLPNTHLAVIHQKAGKRERETLMKEWLPLLWAELGAPQAQSVLYQDGQRLACKIQPTTVTSDASPVKAGGTYLITGGCGGLGLLFAEHFAKTQPVNLILTGRSPLDPAKQSKIKILEDLGSRVRYLQADVSDRDGMREGLNQAKKDFGPIHGLIHAAGIVDKQGILEKEISDFQKVLEPKIRGTLVLDELLAKEDLDFLCYFSSSAAILGDFGVCDYAIANRFLMAYASCRNQEQLQGKRPGKTVVINWPLWKDGGLGMGDDTNTKMYLKSSGQRCLETEEGLALFDRLLSQNNAQHLVLAGYPSRINRFLGLAQETKAVSRSIDFGPADGGRRTEMKGLNLPQCVEWDLKEQISRLLKISRDKLDTEANLADFGFDSLYLADFAVVLTKHFGIEVTPALFFSNATIQKLTQWFLEKNQTAIRDFYQENGGEKTVSTVVPVLPTETKRPELRKARFTMKNALQVPEPIAIIGISGRFPQARDIDEMWSILVEGREAIREIPAERFDWRQYYGDPMKEPGKTNCKWCGSIPGAAEFDPLFFEISPKEAVIMDPRQRLLLQEAWKALEDAGYGEKQIREKKIGMFVGVEEGDYKLLTKEIGGITSHHTGILAARLAYCLDLSGPNMAINTACSSGLVAAHQACLSLRNGECEAAIAAGVNLVLAPEAYIMMSEAGMLSEDGKCYTFDKRANGMVPGEAVAALVLKRLSQAEADGDPIYAVISGSGINYDGKTNGITAPSGAAQTSLIKAVYDQFQVNPEEIEYIVTHGTGTKLGDPVEINALYDAFKEYTKKQGYAALTSTKTNFGHTFAASGLVSLISLVQAFRHETIPASLHCEAENDYINWKESPFYVNKTNRPWPGKDGKSRIGAVSAFGMSGTNAHIVAQSYMREDSGATPALPPYYLLVFSAKTQEALTEKIAEMLLFLQNNDWRVQNLAQISYTLLEGRRHFTYRCAMVIQDREDAIHVLRQMGGKEKLPNLFEGKVPRDFTGQKVMEEFLQDLLKPNWSLQTNQARCREILTVLADLYCQGYEIDGDRLYGDPKPRKIHLPTYPFAREHYWVSGNDAKASRTAVPSTDSTAIHPLLHRNISDFSGQRFSSTFTGRENFLAGHSANGQRVLSGAVYLEMARAAIIQATGNLREGQTGLRLQKVVWATPVVPGGQPVRIQIGIFDEGNNGIAFEVDCESKETGGEPRVLCQGVAVFDPLSEAPPLDLQSLQAQYQNILARHQCYEKLRAAGIEYEPEDQVVELVYLQPGQALAKLVPASVGADTLEQLALDPRMMDAALQVLPGLITPPGDRVDSGPILPFSLAEVEFIRNCTATMWALVHRKDGPAGEEPPQFDLDLCDEQGNICVKLKGFLPRTPESATGATGISTDIGTLILQPYWKEQAVTKGAVAPEYTESLVLFCEPGEDFSENTETLVGGENFRILRSPEKDIHQRYQFYVTRAFEEIQRILKDKPAGKVLVQITLPNQGQSQLFTGLSGLLKTARLENPKLIGQLIEIEPGWDLKKILNILKENRRSPNENHIRYQDGKRWISGWKEVEASKENLGHPWRDRGVYLITGGAGGLGLIFAKEIVRQVKEATLILTGRSPLSKDKQKQLQELRNLGAGVIYQQVDVTDHEAVRSLMGEIGEKFPNLNGIIHSAGVIRDNYILKKTSEELQAVLAPKVAGLVNLDQASKDFRLDFLILFSSSSVCFGNPGQADYVCANAFMDAFAKFRNDLVASEQRQGQTLSINWPLWKEGGMSVDGETRRIMERNTGMHPMETLTGIRALYQVLAAGKDQALVLEGDLPRMREYFLKTPIKDDLPPEIVEIPRVDPKLLRESTLDRLKLIIGEITQLEIGRIDPEEPLESYGIDSIMITQLNQRLAGAFAEVSKTLFYEYQTLGATVEYLTANYPQECLRWAGFQEKATALPEVSPIGLDFHDQLPVLVSWRSEKKPQLNFRTAPHRRTREPIAIIGMSGRFSQAKNLEEYWENLKAGKNCITEIPEERWPMEGFFHPDPQGALAENKSYCKWGAFLEAFDQFDPLFFNISPREAENIDPQVRFFLEECWKAFEDAGYAPSKLPQEVRQKTGVFGGITKQGFPVTSFSSMVNRVSYFLNLQGPSIPVDTMCSSSLVAIHEACEYIREGKGDLAVAGGVNLYLRPEAYIELCMGQLLSTTAKSPAFEKGGTGFVPGEGVGVIILKAYSQAVKDGDQIYAVIRGTAMNHNGKTNGYLTPNPNQQTAVIQEALAQDQIDPRTISYLESAANGSEMGDAIEMTALMKVFGKRGGAEGSFRMGSVKPNIGHCEAASGISQLFKTVLSLKHKTLVPTLHSGDWNPNINFTQLPFQLQQEVSEWKPVVVDGKQVPRRAGITSIGAGGVNAHIIVEEYNPEPETPDHLTHKSEPAVFILSAKNKVRLEEYAKNWIGYLQQNPNLDWERITYTLQVGREEMPCRLAIVTNRPEELICQLEQWLEHRSNNNCCYFGDLNLNKIVLQEAVSQFMKTGSSEEIAKLWVLGNSIPWPDLYQGKRMFRLAQLPAYPFERLTCWKGSNPYPGRKEKYPAQPFTETGVVLAGKENESYTEVEKIVAEVWGRELGLREINVYDHFLDLGGNSIIAVKLEVEMGKKGFFIENSDLEKYPSVAEIALMISGKSNYGSSGNKILEEITPFNDLFYRNCFYNDLFPALKFLGKEITSFLVNDVAVYTCPPDQTENFLTVVYKSNKSYGQLLNDLNIKVNVKLKSEEVVREIILGLSQDRPVIVRIDCFYAPIREDLYQKEHWEHCWLVIGYDEAKQTFKIIEHRHRGSLTYKMYEVSYRDLENSYSGYLQNLYQANNEPTFFEFYLENNDQVPEKNLDDINQKSFATNMIRNKGEILEGLKEIKKFEASFEKIISHDQEIAKNADRIIEMLNEILNARKADLYKIKLLFNEREDLAGLLDKVIKGWDFIRLKLARCLYTSSYDSKTLNAVMKKLANIYQLELDYHLLFFSFLEETDDHRGKAKSV
jgi:polyketide synthase PksN